MDKIHYWSYLSTLFSPKILDEISKYDFSSFNRILHETNFISKIDSSDTVNDIFDKAFAFLEKYYRNEYVYKNFIASKLFLGRHSVKTSCLLNELRVEDSKADLVIINGTSSVYEIKTELDTIERLYKQLRSYLKVFDRVYLVTYANQSKKIIKDLPSNIGLIELTNQNTLKTKREHTSNKQNIQLDTTFNLLRKDEYSKIVKQYSNLDFNSIPNTQIYDVSKRIFEKLSPIEAHDFMVKQLRNRKMHNTDIVKDIPKSLLLNFLITKFNKHAKINLVNNLQKIYF